MSIVDPRVGKTCALKGLARQSRPLRHSDSVKTEARGSSWAYVVSGNPRDGMDIPIQRSRRAVTMTATGEVENGEIMMRRSPARLPPRVLPRGLRS
jgi:hypothetical protein